MTHAHDRPDFTPAQSPLSLFAAESSFSDSGCSSIASSIPATAWKSVGVANGGVAATPVGRLAKSLRRANGATAAGTVGKQLAALDLARTGRPAAAARTQETSTLGYFRMPCED